ncbi:hypothetical protein F2Q68_00018390 [Brassica cretica]|uniref:3-oxoacyl-[acyl-carrier-protein] reductase n=1 Tax=Brassica cretica TaxID=69181 RepID=A0A8S9HQG7_BRACR|nr:hypothetical protein F2Q68_00018390 [Brassica cretica]
MLTLLFSSLALLLLGLLLKFAVADGDLTLISKEVVWITGANRGIGEALAKQFASLGAKLILSARNDAELFRIKSELKGKYAPEHVKVLRLDLPSSEERLKKVVEQAVSLFPGDGVDYLIHNAAYEGLYSNAVDASEENLETTFGVNVFGTISLTKLVTPHMLKRGGGHFVVISNVAGKVPSPGQAMYAASKHALQGYFHSLRSEFYQKGIKVTVVCPGPIETSNGTGTSTSEDENSPEYAPEDVKVLPLDLASGEEGLKGVVEQAVSLFPGAGVDYLVHNAAYERPKSNAVDASEENLKTTFEVNVFGTISLTKLVTPHMLKQGGGHFVVISSAAGKVPSPGQAIYAASKHALQGYFHTLRSEFFRKGIKVTVVCPGPIETSNGTGTSTSEDKKSPEKRVSSERCAELTIIAASHNLKEAWISYQPVLLVMYLVQYMPFLGFWLMDKVGGKRVEVAEKKGNTYSWNLLFQKKTKTN